MAWSASAGRGGLAWLGAIATRMRRVKEAASAASALSHAVADRAHALEARIESSPVTAGGLVNQLAGTAGSRLSRAVDKVGAWIEEGDDLGEMSDMFTMMDAHSMGGLGGMGLETAESVFDREQRFYELEKERQQCEQEAAEAREQQLQLWAQSAQSARAQVLRGRRRPEDGVPVEQMAEVNGATGLLCFRRQPRPPRRPALSDGVECIRARLGFRVGLDGKVVLEKALHELGLSVPRTTTQGAKAAVICHELGVTTIQAASRSNSAAEAECVSVPPLPPHLVLDAAQAAAGDGQGIWEAQAVWDDCPPSTRRLTLLEACEVLRLTLELQLAPVDEGWADETSPRTPASVRSYASSSSQEVVDVRRWVEAVVRASAAATSVPTPSGATLFDAVLEQCRVLKLQSGWPADRTHSAVWAWASSAVEGTAAALAGVGDEQWYDCGWATAAASQRRTVGGDCSLLGSWCSLLSSSSGGERPLPLPLRLSFVLGCSVFCAAFCTALLWPLLPAVVLSTLLQQQSQLYLTSQAAVAMEAGAAGSQLGADSVAPWAGPSAVQLGLWLSMLGLAHSVGQYGGHLLLRPDGSSGRRSSPWLLRRCGGQPLPLLLGGQLLLLLGWLPALCLATTTGSVDAPAIGRLPLLLPLVGVARILGIGLATVLSGTAEAWAMAAASKLQRQRAEIQREHSGRTADFPAAQAYGGRTGAAVAVSPPACIALGRTLGSGIGVLLGPLLLQLLSPGRDSHVPSAESPYEASPADSGLGLSAATAIWGGGTAGWSSEAAMAVPLLVAVALAAAPLLVLALAISAIAALGDPARPAGCRAGVGSLLPSCCCCCCGAGRDSGGSNGEGKRRRRRARGWRGRRRGHERAGYSPVQRHDVDDEQDDDGSIYAVRGDEMSLSSGVIANSDDDEEKGTAAASSSSSASAKSGPAALQWVSSLLRRSGSDGRQPPPPQEDRRGQAWPGGGSAVASNPTGYRERGSVTSPGERGGGRLSGLVLSAAMIGTSELLPLWLTAPQQQQQQQQQQGLGSGEAEWGAGAGLSLLTLGAAAAVTVIATLPAQRLLAHWLAGAGANTHSRLTLSPLSPSSAGAGRAQATALDRAQPQRCRRLLQLGAVAAVLCALTTAAVPPLATAAPASSAALSMPLWVTLLISRLMAAVAIAAAGAATATTATTITPSSRPGFRFAAVAAAAQDHGRISRGVPLITRWLCSDLGLSVLPAMLPGCLWALAGSGAGSGGVESGESYADGDSSSSSDMTWRQILLFGPVAAASVLAGWLA